MEHDTPEVSDKHFSTGISLIRELGSFSDSDGAIRRYHAIWKEARCDDLPYPINIIVFDMCVCLGIQKAIEILQLAIGEPKSGFLNDSTDDLIHLVLQRRSDFYYSLIEADPKMRLCIKGWQDTTDRMIKFIESHPVI